MSENSELEAFLSRVASRNPGECWLWTGSIYYYGYGMFKFRRKRTLAHRWSYQHFVGPIPEGLRLDHTCHNEDKSCFRNNDCPHRRCVNPAHLEPVTQKENVRRGRIPDSHGKKTHCPQGHPYDERNTYFERDGRSRRCRRCNSLRSKGRVYVPRVRKSELPAGWVKVMERLRDLRVERGLSKLAVAAMTGCDATTLGRWESGEHLPTPEHAAAWAAALGAEVNLPIAHR